MVLARVADPRQRGGQYEADTETAVERLYLGGDAYSAPAVYVKEAGLWKIYYICRDYLGSITHIANADGTLKAEYSYDAWGRLRNPATQAAYAPGSEPVLFLGRGYTGHEHLPLFIVVCLLVVTMFGVASLLRQAKNKAVLCVMREHYF